MNFCSSSRQQNSVAEKKPFWEIWFVATTWHDDPRRCGAATFRSTSTQGVVGLWVRDVLQRRISCLEASYKQRANNFCHFMHVCVSAWLKQLRLTMDKYTLSHTSLLYLKMFHMFTLFKMNAFTSVILKKLNFEKIILKKDLTNMGILLCVFVLGFP